MESMTQTRQDHDEGNTLEHDGIDSIIKSQRLFYKSGKTRSFEFRKKQLKKLRALILENEEQINNAVKQDLGRADYVLSFTTGAVITEIDYMLELVTQLRPPFLNSRLKQWMKPKRVRSPLIFFGNRAKVYQVPKGVVLIIGPWNYPFILNLIPLVGAIAAGNCVVIKPSEVAFHTSKMIADLINNNFASEFIHVEEGGVELSEYLVNKPNWDHIFFTGSTRVGRLVSTAAAKNLIPVTLELGGKSPTIVDKNVDLELASRRIVQMKFLNNGQTCMAPDYLLVHKSVKEGLVKLMRRDIERFFGSDVEQSPDYARIINETHFDRLTELKDNGTVLIGGQDSRSGKFISPTIMQGVELESPLMQEEIFGPILPILEWEQQQEVIDFIESRPHPLALYIYSKDKKFQEHILENIHFGGAMTNDSVIYYQHPGVPFGGVGDSGYGNYSGKYSFDTFSQTRPIVETGTLLDRVAERLGIKFFRYPPYTPTKIRLMRFIQRRLFRIRL